MPDRLLLEGRLGWLPATTLLVVCSVLTLQAGVPVDAFAAYALYVVLCIVLPGFIVHRALRGAMESRGADLALGAATGTALELIAWAAAVGSGHGDLLRWWPLLTLPLLLARPVRRRVLDPGGSRPLLVSVATCTAALLAALYVQRSFLLATPLPPSSHTYYYDLLWHLGLAGEATRSFPLGTPQLVGDGDLKYHWFSNAHMAAGALITGVDVPTVGLRLWVLPSVVLAVALTAALGHRVAGRSSAAAVAAALVVPVATLPWVPWAVLPTDFWSPLSPSQLYAHTPLLLAAHSLVDIVRGRASRGTWVVLALAALACSGAKASALPVLLGGIGVAWLAALVLRQGRVRVTVLGVLTLVATAVASRLVQGGSGGSTLQLFSNLTLSPVYRGIVDRTPDLKAAVAPGFFGEGRGGLLLLALLLLFEAIRMLRLFAWLAVPMMRTLRRDLAAWFLSGAAIASLIALVVISHAGYSQFYFPFSAMPLGAVLCAWVVCELVSTSTLSRGAMVAAVAVGAAINGVVSTLALRRPLLSGEEMHAAVAGVHRGVAVGLGITLIGGVAMLVVGRERRTRGIATLSLVLVGAVAVSGLTQSIHTEPTVVGALPAAATPTQRLSWDQSRAAMWIRQHVPQEAVVATNVQCIARQDIACPTARSWWVSGLGQRRVLLEGWDYIPSTGGAAFDDDELYALNQSAFTDPSPESLEALRSRGVSWLVAVEGVSGAPVSPALDAMAPAVHTVGSVSIHRLG